jgi:hypothetical protein
MGRRVPIRASQTGLQNPDIDARSSNTVFPSGQERAFRKLRSEGAIPHLLKGNN